MNISTKCCSSLCINQQCRAGQGHGGGCSQSQRRGGCGGGWMCDGPAGSICSSPTGASAAPQKNAFHPYIIHHPGSICTASLSSDSVGQPNRPCSNQGWTDTPPCATMLMVFCSPAPSQRVTNKSRYWIAWFKVYFVLICS